jgi:hypothetical protein
MGSARLLEGRTRSAAILGPPHLDASVVGRVVIQPRGLRFVVDESPVHVQLEAEFELKHAAFTSSSRYGHHSIDVDVGPCMLRAAPHSRGVQGGVFNHRTVPRARA